MKRRMRGWLIALGMLILLLGSLAYYGVAALRPPTASAAAAIRTAAWRHSRNERSRSHCLSRNSYASPQWASYAGERLHRILERHA